MTKYLFLDINGVLNDERIYGVNPDCVNRLNQIIVVTDPKIVISSSWRKDIYRGHITLTGFERILIRLGVDCRHRLVGITETDDYIRSRGELISAWLFKNAT